MTMTPAARERMQVRTPLLAISAVAWLLLVIRPGGMALPAHCLTAMPGGMSSTTLGELLAINPPATLAVGWVLMLAAMMVPLLIPPVRHIRDRSFVQRRPRAIALFTTGYVAIWMAAGAMLIGLALAIQLAVSGPLAALALEMVIALIWQVSPLKQRCLNRCHAHPALAAFGRAADIDALRFGLTHGVWCAGSCWALMLLPLLVSRGHLAAMAAVTLWLAAERLDRPTTPRWSWRAPAQAMRIAVLRMRLQRT
jgi:predicted metal-binding membrane protein